MGSGDAVDVMSDSFSLGLLDVLLKALFILVGKILKEVVDRVPIYLLVLEMWRQVCLAEFQHLLQQFLHSGTGLGDPHIYPVVQLENMSLQSTSY